MKEPFVYLWYIASTKRYYLGVAIGKPYYTHSSTNEELCAIVPHSKNSLLEERKEFWDKYERGEIEGVRYRILPKRFILNVPYLTEDIDDYGKMCEREHVLLKNRFERCWNKYYNESLGDPRYVDQFGENNPMYGRTGENHPQWKGGVTNDKEYQKKMIKLWRANNKEHIKAYQKKYEQNPHVKEIRKRSEKNRVRPPEYEKWLKEYMKSPEHKAYQKEYDKKRNQTPERKAANNRRSAAYRARKKAETQGEGNLDLFLK